ncbi:MAG: pseudouridine synthase [Cellvibrionaceae bacterium]|nr:pseudouridine synthase [Cellvibrionaceae bacterium]
MPSPANIILLNKPFGVLSQFSDVQQRPTLAKYIPKQFKTFYPAGRLDFDSEGLLLLTNNGKLQQRIAHPSFKLLKTYWVQVEGEIDHNALEKLRAGVELKDGYARAQKVSHFEPPHTLWARQPPIRVRRNIAAPWISLSINEGRNRQVRRMTAAVGFPTLRLIRYAIGHWTLGELSPGEFITDKINLPS